METTSTTTLDDEQRLTETFAALASPTRRSILARLAVGEATVNELAEPFAMKLPAISKHLKVLERAGLITGGHRAQYRSIWETRFDQMGDYLTTLMTKENSDG